MVICSVLFSTTYGKGIKVGEQLQALRLSGQVGLLSPRRLHPKGIDFTFSFSLFFIFLASPSSDSWADADRLGKATLNLKVT